MFKNLIFTITFNVMCTSFTILVLNVHHRRPEIHGEVPKIVRRIFLQFLPKFLWMRQPDRDGRSRKKVSFCLSTYNCYQKELLRKVCSEVSKKDQEKRSVRLSKNRKLTAKDRNFEDLIYRLAHSINRMDTVLRSKHRTQKVCLRK
jgi:hypothetical protein